MSLSWASTLLAFVLKDNAQRSNCITAVHWPTYYMYGTMMWTVWSVLMISQFLSLSACYKVWYKERSMKSLMLHDQKVDLLTYTFLINRHCWDAAATTGKPLLVLGRRHPKLSIGSIGSKGMSPPRLQHLDLPRKMLILLVLLRSPKWLLLTLHCTRRILLEPCDSTLGWRPPMLPGTRVRLTN